MLHKHHKQFNPHTAQDIGGAVSRQADRPIGPLGWLALAALAATGSWLAAQGLNGFALAAAQADAQESRAAAAAANIARDKAAAALANNQAQIRALCTATGMGGAPNGKP